MLKIIIAAMIVSSPAFAASTWQLDDKQNWDLIATDPQTKFLEALSDVQKLVDERKTKAAEKEFKALKENFPKFTGPDLNLFVKAEILLSKKKFTKAASSYDKMLTKYPDSLLKDSAIKRQYKIGMAFMSGSKHNVLGFIPVKGDDTGIGILEKMTDHAGYSSTLAVDASITIAKNYEKRKKFNEAYLKWWEVYSLAKKNPELDRDSLFGMARNKFAQYNKNPASKRAFYDASSLRSAKSYFEMFRSSYPEDANAAGVNETLSVINEELAYKELSTGLYYYKVGKKQAANLYFDMVINNWPDTKSAETAWTMLKSKTGS